MNFWSNNMNYNNDSPIPIYKLVVGGLIIGTIFGFSVQRCNVYLPQSIIDQMNFKNFSMLKLFLTFILTSLLSTLLLYNLNLINIKSSESFYQRNFIGGFIMGIGIFISGSCPGVLLAQIPAFNRFYILLGGILGGVAYGYSDKYINNLLPEEKQVPSTLYELFNIPFQTFSILVSFIVLIFIYLVELKSDHITNINPSTSIWSPYITGLVFGVLQIPSYLVSSGGIGTSSSYVVVGGLLLKLFKKLDQTKYIKKIMQPPKGIFQPFFDIGIIIGSFLSLLSNPAPVSQFLNSNFGKSDILKIIGGFLLIYGARLANGCTSGAVTGMAKLELGSFIICFAFFFGAISTCFISQSI